jgi:hypothetical protein
MPALATARGARRCGAQPRRRLHQTGSGARHAAEEGASAVGTWRIAARLDLDADSNVGAVVTAASAGTVSRPVQIDQGMYGDGGDVAQDPGVAAVISSRYRYAVARRLRSHRRSHRSFHRKSILWWDLLQGFHAHAGGSPACPRARMPPGRHDKAFPPESNSLRQPRAGLIAGRVVYPD